MRVKGGGGGGGYQKDALTLKATLQALAFNWVYEFRLQAAVLASLAEVLW